jgi:hypothetical protein
VPLLRRGTIPTVLLLDPASFARPEPFDPSTTPFDSAQGELRAGLAQDKRGETGDSSGTRAQSPALASSRARSVPSLSRSRVIEGVLVDLGVAHYVITRDLLGRPEARPDQQGYWGRAVSGTAPRPIRQPREIGWEVLSQ